MYATIASKIYDAIDAHGISKEDLAKRVGIPLKYLSQLLDGEFPITIKMMVQLATALGFKWNLGVLAESHEGPKAH